MPVASKSRSKSKKIPETPGQPLTLTKNRVGDTEGQDQGAVDFQLPADGWFQIAKVGDWYHTASGLTQIVDALSVTSIVDAFKRDASQENFPGLLVDRDHFSHDSERPTEALCWITEMEGRGEGVWAKGRWTSLGSELTEGGVYRLISPVFSDFEHIEGEGCRARPRKITRVALTNDPNCKGMVPVSNRADGGTTRGDASNAAGATTMNYRDKLCRALGLPTTASDEEIEGAETKVETERNKQNRMNEQELKAAADAKAENERLKTENAAMKNRLVESTMTTFDKVIGDRKAVWKNRLEQNYDSTREILAEMETARVTAETEAANRANAGKGADGKATDGKNRAIGDPAKAGQKPTHNRDNGAHPDSADGDGIASNDPRLTAALAGVTQAARELMNRSPQVSWTQAYRQALNAARAAGQIPMDLVSV